MLRVVAIASVLFGLVAHAHAGQATCSNPGVPVGAAASSELLPGRVTLSLSGGFLPLSDEETLDDVSGPVRYDSHLTLVETRLSAEYALSKYLALGAALPYRVVDVDVDYHDPATGMPLDPTFAGIHARTETLRGLGDGSAWLHGAYVLRGHDRIHVRVGATLPLGDTLDEDPFELGAIGQEHEHIQLGTGTVMPMIGAELQHAFDPIGRLRVTGALWGLGYVSLYENGSGYKPSTRISGGLGVAAPLFPGLVLTLNGEVHGETAEKWHGVVPVDEGNAGRYDVLAGPTLAWRATDQLAVTADFRYTLYSHVTGNQLDYGMVASLGVVASFDTRARPSYHGLDEAPVGPAGLATALEPVAGKLTAFDLWADWCAPCRELDERLVALARRYPDKLAIRKLEVVDPDSPAWKMYLAPGNFSLPHVKLYGPDRRLIFEATAPPAELAARIEAALR